MRPARGRTRVPSIAVRSPVMTHAHHHADPGATRCLWHAVRRPDDFSGWGRRTEVRQAITPTVTSVARRAAVVAAATKSPRRPDSRWATKARYTWSGWASTTGT